MMKNKKHAKWDMKIIMLNNILLFGELTSEIFVQVRQYQFAKSSSPTMQVRLIKFTN